MVPRGVRVLNGGLTFAGPRGISTRTSVGRPLVTRRHSHGGQWQGGRVRVGIFFRAAIAPMRMPPCTGLLAAEPSRRPTFRNGGLALAGKEACAWKPVARRTRRGQNFFSALRLPPCNCLHASGLLGAKPSRRPTFRKGGLTFAGKEACAWKPVAGRTRQGQSFFLPCDCSHANASLHWPPCCGAKPPSNFSKGRPDVRRQADIRMEASGREDESGSEFFSALRLPPCECLPANGLLAAKRPPSGSSCLRRDHAAASSTIRLRLLS